MTIPVEKVITSFPPEIYLWRLKSAENRPQLSLNPHTKAPVTAWSATVSKLAPTLLYLPHLNLPYAVKLTQNKKVINHEAKSSLLSHADAHLYSSACTYIHNG
tara:strand:- start:168 stop:476 length:309 start_codon:yes stop_codon:yes gene_type:complete